MNDDPAQSEHTRLYEERYRGDYMDKDSYSLWTKKSPTTAKVYDTLLQVPANPRRVLDFGCGVGGWIEMLASMYPDSRISGVDISSVAIDKARERYPDCEFATFDGSICPYADAEFDLIFSFHVLEHVANIETSIAEISRLLRRNGHACIIFPCGNKGSLQHILMSHMQGGILPTGDGREVHFFEIPDGHLRRMTSSETVRIFARNGLKLKAEFYSGQLFGWIDWLCRGTGPHYINQMFSREPQGNIATRIFVRLMHKTLLLLNSLIRKEQLDLNIKRNPLKQLLVLGAKLAATTTDAVIRGVSELEWKLFRRFKNGSAQYLVFHKP